MRIPVSLRLAWISVGVITAAISLRADPVDEVIAKEMAKHHIPGLSLAIIQDGKIVKAQGYGVIEAGRPERVTVDTLFQAGSVSKSVTALGVLSLVESGKLSLDADVNGALKSWHVPENEFTKVEKVTLRRLLSHSAGLTVHGFPGYAVDAATPSLVQVLNGEPPANTPAIRVDFMPGSQWRYSGGGYTIMQQLVIDTTGQTFPEFMRQAVLKPLLMDASGFDQPLPAARAALTATGHLGGGKVVPGRWHIYPEMAAAGLWTTASDLARFAIALQESLAGRAHPVISPAMTQVMLTPQKQDDGLGVFLAGKEKGLRFWHNGRDEGFDALMTAYVHSGQGAVVMINKNEDSSAVPRIMSAIAAAYGWPDYPVYHPPKPIADKEPEVTATVKTIFAEAQQGRYDASLYTPELGAIIAKGVPGTFTQQLQAFGKLQAIELTGHRTPKDARIYRYRLTYENETVTVDCVYNAAGQIAGLRFSPE